MALKKIHWIGMVFGGIILLIDLLFFTTGTSLDKNLFLFFAGLGIGILALPFIIELIIENKRDQEIADMFLEFSRNLAESVSTGTPISKSIVNMRKRNYGSLGPYIEKLANQITIGIPVNKAFHTFATDVDNAVVTRAVTLISEAEKAGGEIDYILDSSAKAVAEVEKLKKERKAATYNLVVQGYIIFFIFIGIMLVMEFKILPLVTNIGAANFFSSGDITAALQQKTVAAGSEILTPEKLANPLLYLLLAQGFFAGLIIGKLTEGSIKAGVKHSFILTLAAFLISIGVRLVLGTPEVTGLTGNVTG